MTKRSLDRRLQTAIAAAFLVLIFFLPLVLSTRSSEVFELPKMLFVYAMTGVICGLWLGRMTLRREILIRRTPLDIPILLFLISQIASTIYSIDPAVSWWGWYGRFHGGLWSTISYTLLYYAMVSNYSGPTSFPVIGSLFSVFSSKFIGYQFTGLKPMDRKPVNHKPTTENRGLITAILASAAVVSIYAILQHFGVDKDFWVQDVVNRVFSTQGQPNWLAAYLVMTIPLVFVITISEIINHKSYSLSLRWNARYMISYFLFLIFFLALLWTKSRSGLVGLAAADGVFWLVSLAKTRTKDEGRRTKVKQFIFIHLIGIILVLITNNPVRLQPSAFNLRPSPTKSEHGGTESGDIRRIVWNGAIQLVKQRPVFGFGPETFGETYWRVRPKEHNLTSEWNFLYNKAHNEWLNLAANTGIFGLGSHLLLLGWFTVWSMNQIRNQRLSVFGYQFSVAGSSVFSLPVIKPTNRKLADYKLTTENREQITGLQIAILAALLGAEAVNFFGFSTVTIGAYRYLFMAAAVSAAGNINKLLKTLPDRQGSSVINIVSKLLKPIADRAVTSVIQDRDRDENLRKNMDLRQKFILAGLSVFILYLISQVSIFFLADLAYNRGRAYQDGGYIEEAVEPLMQAVNLVPGEPVFRVELAEAEGVFASLINQKSDIINHKDELINQLKNDSIANFEIVRKQSPHNLGFIRTQARILFLLGEEEQAVQLMKLAMELAPTNPQLPYSLGVMLGKMGNEEEAAVYYNKAVELKPDYSVSPPSSDPVTLTPSSLR